PSTFGDNPPMRLRLSNRHTVCSARAAVATKIMAPATAVFKRMSLIPPPFLQTLPVSGQGGKPRQAVCGHYKHFISLGIFEFRRPGYFVLDLPRGAFGLLFFSSPHCPFCRPHPAGCLPPMILKKTRDIDRTVKEATHAYPSCSSCPVLHDTAGAGA